MLETAILALLLLSAVQPAAVSHIAGGQHDTIDQHRYLVRIQSTVGICGGSLIAKGAVLTAAHCTPDPCPAAYTIHLGSNTHAEMDLGDKLTAVSVHSHRGYHAASMSGADISVIRVTQDHRITSFLTVGTTSVAEGTTAHLEGWGREYAAGNLAPHLKTLNFTVVAGAVCQRALGTHDDSTHLCGDSGVEDSASCMGDSGGPLVMGTTAVGVVSYGSKYCQGSNTAFTRVAVYSKWIEKILALEPSPGEKCSPAQPSQPGVPSPPPGPPLALVPPFPPGIPNPSPSYGQAGLYPQAIGLPFQDTVGPQPVYAPQQHWF